MLYPENDPTTDELFHKKYEEGFQKAEAQFKKYSDDFKEEHMDQEKGDVKIITFNARSLRDLHICKGTLKTLIDKYNPDILGISEVKCPKILMEITGIRKFLEDKGYKYQYLSSCKSSKKNFGYAGSLIVSKIKPVAAMGGVGDPKVDIEGRVVTLIFENFVFAHTYAASSGFEMKFSEKRMAYENARIQHLNRLKKLGMPVIYGGDVNNIDRDVDCFDILSNPARKLLPGNSDRERLAHQIFKKEVELFDVWLEQHPNKDSGHFTFWMTDSWNRHKKGWRLDYILATEELRKNDKRSKMYFSEIKVLHDIWGSDHGPLMTILKNSVRKFKVDY
jgi:exodeoxyribonuclease-3